MKELVSMPRFAVYYIPPSRSPFYRLGTSILRYDVRARTMMHADNPIRAQIPQFQEGYVAKPQSHGLHSSIIGPYQFDPDNLPEIEATVADVLSCFDPTSVFTLRAHRDFVTFWNSQKEIVVLRYEPNAALISLHTLLLTGLVRYASGSTYYPQYKDHQAHFSTSEWQRIRHFYHPNVLDGYNPHFTLLYPYGGDRHKEVERILRSLFGKFTTHKMESICLMMQSDKDAEWQIVREFER
jgi:hypothetical protein